MKEKRHDERKLVCKQIKIIHVMIRVLQKLRNIHSKNHETVHILKEASKNLKKPQEWIKLKDIKHYNHLLSLEKYELITIRNVDEIRILNPITSELVNKF